MGSKAPTENVNAEMYLTKIGGWEKLEDFPFDEEDFYFCEYAALYHDSAFYLFGGMTRSSYYSQTIARLDTTTLTWSKVGCGKLNRFLYFSQSFSLSKKLGL